MFALTAVQAFFGDSLVVEYGETGSPRYLLIDGGPAYTYEKHLSAVLQRLKQEGHDLELMILSHVDTDHVTGLLDLIADVRGGSGASLPSIKALWHNSFAGTIDPNNVLAPRLKVLLATAGAETMTHSAIAINGIAEGHQLRTHALAVPILLNPGFADGVVMAETAAPWKSKNLQLTVVGPTEPNLKALRTEWEEWLEDNEDALSNSDDPYVMANSDRSVPNLSSIQLLAEADGKTMLLTGDGRSDHLLQALKQGGLLDGDGKTHVDLLKLPHHGSNRNVTKTFFKKITADTYVASADGKDDNPDLATLIWIVEAASDAGRKIRIVSTNETESTQKLAEEYDADDYGYTLDIMGEGNHEIRIPLS